MSGTNPNYITCSCHHCGGNIEFDGKELEQGETRTIDCPHCQIETTIFNSEVSIGQTNESQLVKVDVLPPVIPVNRLPVIESKRKKPNVIRSLAKWVVIGWSVFCLIGIVWGMLAMGSTLSENPTQNDYQMAGAGIGIGCGLAIWLVIWAAIALPATLVWIMSSRKLNDE